MIDLSKCYPWLIEIFQFFLDLKLLLFHTLSLEFIGLNIYGFDMFDVFFIIFPFFPFFFSQVFILLLDQWFGEFFSLDQCLSKVIGLWFQFLEFSFFLFF